MKVFNINSNVKITAMFRWSPVSLDQFYLGVARHVQQGIYSLVSINAIAYSFTLVCDNKVSAEEFEMAWKKLFSKSCEYKYTDEDWDKYLDAQPSERERLRGSGKAR